MTTERPQFSVVIPTFNRCDVLREVVNALDEQQGAPTFEIVIVDDGSTDGTEEWLGSLEASARPRRIVVDRQQNAGPAAARNRGVALSSGVRVAFLGDDTVPSKGWLGAHARAAGRSPDVRKRVAVLGYTSWHPRMKVNPFLSYINSYGLQFGYRIIEDPDDVPFNFFYTSNISLDRALLVENGGFDLGFPYPAWEDIELSYRLVTQCQLRIVYRPEASVAHDHPTDLNRFADRQEKAGYCATVLARRHPELSHFVGLGDGQPPARRGARWIGLLRALAHGLQNLPVHTPGLWERLLRFHYEEGLRRGWHEGAGVIGGES